MRQKYCIPRKWHECRVCGEAIQKGEACERWSGLMEGEGWFTSHAHLICGRFMEAHRHEDWECILPGDCLREEVEEWEYEMLMGETDGRQKDGR